MARKGPPGEDILVQCATGNEDAFSGFDDPWECVSDGIRRCIIIALWVAIADNVEVLLEILCVERVGQY